MKLKTSNHLSDILAIIGITLMVAILVAFVVLVIIALVKYGGVPISELPLWVLWLIWK